MKRAKIILQDNIKFYFEFTQDLPIVAFKGILLSIIKKSYGIDLQTIEVLVDNEYAILDCFGTKIIKDDDILYIKQNKGKKLETNYVCNITNFDSKSYISNSNNVSSRELEQNNYFNTNNLIAKNHLIPQEMRFMTNPSSPPASNSGFINEESSWMSQTKNFSIKRKRFGDRNKSIYNEYSSHSYDEKDESEEILVRNGFNKKRNRSRKY